MLPKMMSGAILWSAMLLLPGALPAAGQTQPPAKVSPKLEPVAETRLLMEGLAHANFRGLERLLTTKPPDVQTWTFARGQALLISETANLLMLRPPKGQGQPIWFERATDLRNASKQLAATIASQDYEKSKAGLTALAITCNRCHQAFRVPTEIVAFQDKGEKI
jgi:hypothetical protein